MIDIEFNEKESNPTFYYLVNPEQWDEIDYGVNSFLVSSYIESYVTRGLLKKAIGFIRTYLAFEPLVRSNITTDSEARSRIFKVCNDLDKAVDKLSAERTDNRIQFNIIKRYLEHLVFAVSQEQLDIRLVPEDWITTNDFIIFSAIKELNGPTSTCRINPDLESRELLCKERYQKYSLLGLLYSSGFSIKLGVGKFRELLHKTSELNDFIPNSTKDFIQLRFNPQKNREQIKDFLDIFSKSIPNHSRSIYDPDFNPSHLISPQLYDYIRSVIKSFPDQDEELVLKALDASFDVEEDDSSRYNYEVGLLIKVIDDFIEA